MQSGFQNNQGYIQFTLQEENIVSIVILELSHNLQTYHTFKVAVKSFHNSMNELEYAQLILEVETITLATSTVLCKTCVPNMHN